MEELSFLGSGILLLFTLMKGLIISTGIFFFAYAIYALIMYAQGSQYLTNPLANCKTTTCKFKDRFSSYNTVDPNTIFFILDWIGIGAMILWIIISRIVKEYGFYQNDIIDADL